LRGGEQPHMGKSPASNSKMLGNETETLSATTRVPAGMITKRIIVLAIGLLVAGGASAVAAPKPVLVRGSIASFTPSAITVKTATGLVVVGYASKTIFVGADPGSLADIVPGTFVGMGSVPDAGGSRALEVTVFDEKLRGRGEGDRPWEAPTTHPSSRMTNGTVATPKVGTMTNGTVGKMAGDSKTVTVNYKGGARKIVVTKATSIVRVAPGTPKLLSSNASVFIRAITTPAGLAAGFVVVGKNGTVVPL